MADDTHTEHGKLYERIDQVMAEVQAARKEASGAHEVTDGRVSVLEAKAKETDRVLNGYTVGTRTVPGIAQRLDDIDPVIDDVRALVCWTKRLLGAFALSVVAALGVVLVDRL